MNSINKDQVFYAVNELLTVTNVVAQDGAAWTLRFPTPLQGLDTATTYTSREAAVDAVANVIRGRVQSIAA